MTQPNEFAISHTILIRASAQLLYDMVTDVAGRTWETRSQVVVAAPAREFAFVVGGAYVRWGYTLTSGAQGTEVTESWEFLPAGIAMFHERYGDNAATQIADRTRTARQDIPATLLALKQVAEAAEPTQPPPEPLR